MKDKVLTTLTIKAGKNEYQILYSGSLSPDKDPLTDKRLLRHDFRLMQVLTEDDRLFDFLFSILQPVSRFRNRELKKRQKQQAQQSPITTNQ